MYKEEPKNETTGKSNHPTVMPGNASVFLRRNIRRDVGSAQSESGTKNELKVAIRAEPSTLDPHNSTALANFAVQRVVYDTLVVQNENGEIVPGLAESWEVIDDLTVRFHLREGVKFSNGRN